jgi:GH24 family phage-related lysozyme (muramidase)/uncharacterized protein (DUF2345 family)
MTFNTNLRSTKTLQNEKQAPLGRMSPYYGVYVGLIKDASDVQRNGRLKVWVPELGTAPEEVQGWIIVSYCTPFAGATNNETTSRSDLSSFEGTQTSYGLWMVPPDVNTKVVVMFLNGDPSKGIWMGCLYDQFMNNMVPGMASSANTYQYNGKDVPAAEYNKWDSTTVVPDATKKPYEATKFKGLGNQGLITDNSKGTTTSSARREAPSAVYGILTPGPVIDKTASPANIRRKGGSSLIMDDGESSEYVQLATKSGAQIRLDETNGFVYLINRDGTAWVQMDQHGNIDIFGATNISMRAQRDFNIRADRNINIEAGQNIFMKAAKDTTESTTTFTYDVNNTPKPTTIPVWQYKGEGNGEGGNIVMQALNNWHSTTQSNAFLTVKENNMNVAIGNSFALTTIEGGQNYSSKQGIKMTTDAAYDLAATGDIRVGTNGKLSVVAGKDMAFCSSANMSLNAVEDIIITSGNVVSVDGISLEIGTNVKMENLDANAVKADSINSGTVKSDTVVFNAQPIGGGGPAAPQAPTTASPVQTDPAMSASPSQFAEIKPMNDKINILATWSDPESKFKRNSQSFQTTASRLATYEPCPENETFSRSSVSGYTPPLNQADLSYQGSGSPGNTPTQTPPASTVPGSDNTSVPADPVSNDVFSKDVNQAALRCQLIRHEGYRTTVYPDSLSNPTAGIGHLLRTNEIAQYPVGSPISAEQIEIWYEQDVATAIKIAQDLIGDAWSSLSDIRKRAVCDLAYNLGRPRLSKFTKFICGMQLRNYHVAVLELRNSLWFTQVGQRGVDIIVMVGQDTDPTGCDKKFPG